MLFVNPLVAFCDIHGTKGMVLLFRTPETKKILIYPLTATDVYIRQILLFPQSIKNVCYIYRGVNDMEKFDA
jgi:hypothetical protein